MIAISTALVREVPPVNTGSLIDAVKQNLDFCRTTPADMPKIQKTARMGFTFENRIPATTIRNNKIKAIGTWFFLFFAGLFLVSISFLLF
jgi:hypothetical protein